jgi:hypothetical protein
MTEKYCEPFHSCEQHSDQCPDFGPCPVCDKTVWFPIDKAKTGKNYWMIDSESRTGVAYFHHHKFYYNLEYTDPDFDKPEMIADFKPPEVKR